MELTLGPEDAALLERILFGYLSDLRTEIAATDSAEWRREMRHEEEWIGTLLDLVRRRLEPEAGATPP